MKIALITSLYPPHTDGVGDYTRRLARAFVQEGCGVVVICKKTAHAPETDPGFRVVEAGTRWDQAGYRAVECMLEAEQPDIAVLQYVPHGFEARGLPLSLGWWAGRWARQAPLAVFFHEVRVRYQWGQPKSWVAAGAEQLLARRLCRIACATMTSIPGYADLLSGAPLVVPVGANIAPLQGTAGEASARVTRLVAFGQRDYRALLSAVGDLNRQGAGLHLMVCGNAPSGRAMEGVQYTGVLPEGTLARHFAEAQLFVLADGAGGTSLKSGSLAAALGAGLPVVGVKGRLTAPPLAHGHNIWLADGPTAGAMEAAIRHVVERPALRRHLATGARQLWEGTLQWADIARKQLAHLRAALAHTKS